MKTKIIITFGPACDNLRILKKIIESGAKIIRLNSKYIHYKNYEKIRQNIIKAGKAKMMIDIKNRTILKKITHQKFDYLAISFAENPIEINEIREMFPKKIKIISKIETKKRC